MSEKRFELSKTDLANIRLYDYKEENAYFLDCDEHTSKCLVELLNNLSEENEQLREQLAHWKSIALLGKGKGFR